jgi:hypothetical protein
LGLYGSAETASVSGTNSVVCIGGNGQAASNANDDHVTLGQGGVVYESDNSRVDVSGSGVTALVGNSDILGLYGSAETASVSGTNSVVCIGGNGQAASNANDDHVTLAQGGVVYESDNSRVDVSGSGVTALVGNSDVLGLISGSGTMRFISSAQDTLSITANAGSQSVVGFNMAHGDQIDLSEFLSGVSLTPDLSNLGNYISVLDGGSNTTISVVGPDGSDTVLLAGVGSLSLHDLITGDAFVFPQH